MDAQILQNWQDLLQNVQDLQNLIFYCALAFSGFLGLIKGGQR